MPNLASSKKDLRRTERRTAFNDRLKTRVKKAVKNFNTLLAQNNTEKAVAALQQATKVLGKAAQKNVFKKKTLKKSFSLTGTVGHVYLTLRGMRMESDKQCLGPLETWISPWCPTTLNEPRRK